MDLRRCLEPTHVTFSLPDVLVGDFSPVVLVPAGSMGRGWEDLPVRRLIASKLVGDEFRRRPLLVFPHSAEAAFGSSAIPAARDSDIQDLAVLVHCSPKKATLPADRSEHLIHMPDVTESALSPSQSTSVRGSKLPAQKSNGLVGYVHATPGKEILDIAGVPSESMA